MIDNSIHIHINESKEDIEPEQDIEPEEQNYIYCLMEREFLKTKETIYKVGKTTNMHKRLSQYPKGSELIFLAKVRNCHKAEKELLALLDSKVTKAREIGREYYNCDINIIFNLFFQVVNQNI